MAVAQKMKSPNWLLGKWKQRLKPSCLILSHTQITKRGRASSDPSRQSHKPSAALVSTWFALRPPLGPILRTQLWWIEPVPSTLRLRSALLLKPVIFSNASETAMSGKSIPESDSERKTLSSQHALFAICLRTCRNRIGSSHAQSLGWQFANFMQEPLPSL